jgi:hypothetical protein
MNTAADAGAGGGGVLLTVDAVIASTGAGAGPMHTKKRKRLEKLSNEQLIAYQLRTKMVNACRV